MKIGHLDTPTARTTAAGERTASRAAPAAQSTEASAQVALSSTASSLVAGGDPTFDAEKVQRIAQAIRDGSFKVDAGAIADRLIANAQELLVPPQH